MNSIQYDPLLVGLSYVISVFGSYTALQLAIAIPQARTWAAAIGSVTGATVALGLACKLRGNLQRFGSGIVMGIAVCGMHYTGMYAVRMEHTKEAVPATGISLSPSDMAYSVFAVTAVLLTLLLIYSAWKAQRTLRVDI